MRIEHTSKIFVAGHRGLVGSAIVRTLEKNGYHHLILKSRSELDLRNQQAVQAFFAQEKPEFVFLAAAKVGGIGSNMNHPADFIRDNLQIQTHVIDSAYQSGVKKLVFLGSSCIYPKFASQPISEDSLLTGALEPTNAAYAIAKIAGITMCQSYSKQFGMNAISLMPTNLYGPFDNFDLENSHVLPALIRKFIEAKNLGKPQVTVWGSGSPMREFLYVDDLADATLFLMKSYDDSSIINVGTGTDISIKDLAYLIAKEVGFQGSLVFDTSKPDGTPRKLLDTTKISKLGWKPAVSLEEGIRRTIQWYQEPNRTKLS